MRTLRSLLLSLLTAALTFAQITGTASRTNDNTFQAGKTQTFLGVVDMGGATQTRPCRRGTGAPTGQNGNQGDCYFDNTATPGSNLWWATTGGIPATWTLQAGAGGVGGGSVSEVAITGTTSLTYPIPSGSKTVTIFTKVLSVSASSAAITGSFTPGQIVITKICQNGTGGFDNVYPTAFLNFPEVVKDPSGCVATSGWVNAAGNVELDRGITGLGGQGQGFPCINGTAPPVPVAGRVKQYCSSVDGKFHMLEPDGTDTVWGAGGVGSASDATVTFTDITTNNSSTSKHGFVPKLPNDATKYYDGTGAYTVPSVGSVSSLARAAVVDAQSVQYREEFWSSAWHAASANVPYPIYAYGNGTTPTEATKAAEANHFGIVTLGTGAANNDDAYFLLKGANNSDVFGRLDNITGFWFRRIFRPNQTTSMSMRWGPNDQSLFSTTINNGFGIRFDTALSDTNYMFETIIAGTKSATSSGVAPNASSWIVFDCYSDVAGTIKFQINGGSVTSKTYTGTTALSLIYWLKTLSANVRSMDEDMWAFYIPVTR